jgi:hypothetical protein
MEISGPDDTPVLLRAVGVGFTMAALAMRLATVPDCGGCRHRNRLLCRLGRDPGSWELADGFCVLAGLSR